jgi:hypothetical protein
MLQIEACAASVGGQEHAAGPELVFRGLETVLDRPSNEDGTTRPPPAANNLRSEY